MRRYTQVRRMESLGHEVVPFEDVVCQMWDMLKLGDRSYVTLQVGYYSTSQKIHMCDCMLPVTIVFGICAPPCYCSGFTVVQGKRRHGDFRVLLSPYRLKVADWKCFRIVSELIRKAEYMILVRHDSMGSLRPCAFAGLPEAGGSEGGRRFLRCSVQLEQIYRLRATGSFCGTSEEERSIRDRLGQVSKVDVGLFGYFVYLVPVRVPLYSVDFWRNVHSIQFFQRKTFDIGVFGASFRWCNIWCHGVFLPVLHVLGK